MYPSLSGYVFFFSIAYSSVLFKTLLFRAFSQVFVYPATLLSGLTLFSTECDCLLLWGLLLGTLLRSFSSKMTVFFLALL